MAKNISIVDLKIDQRIVGEAFALKEFERKVSRQGKPYYNVLIGDKTGEIRGKVWTESMQNCDENPGVGEIVDVSAVVQEYNGKPQLIIESLRVSSDMAPEEFLPVTDRNRDEIKDLIEDEISKTKNPHLKKLLELFWLDENNRDKFMNYPAGEYVHHGYVGGLAEHVWEMLEMSRPYFKLYPLLNRDLFFTGLFFHDIGKLEELDIVGAAIIRTSAGRLVAHIGQGLLFVDQLVKQIPDFPEDLRDKLYHLILSHQGKLEYGSPVQPQMLEALVLSFVDNNSADMNQAVKHIEKHKESGEDFTDYHKWLGRSLYQKDYLGSEDTDSQDQLSAKRNARSEATPLF